MKTKKSINKAPKMYNNFAFDHILKLKCKIIDKTSFQFPYGISVTGLNSLYAVQ